SKISELAFGGLASVCLAVALAIAIEHRARDRTGEECRAMIIVSRMHGGAAPARRRHPDRRLRLLQNARPDGDGSVPKMIAIPGEICFPVGQRFDDEVMRFPKRIHEPDGVFI